MVGRHGPFCHWFDITQFILYLWLQYRWPLLGTWDFSSRGQCQSTSFFLLTFSSKLPSPFSVAFMPAPSCAWNSASLTVLWLLLKQESRNWQDSVTGVESTLGLRSICSRLSAKRASRVDSLVLCRQTLGLGYPRHTGRTAMYRSGQITYSFSPEMHLGRTLFLYNLLFDIDSDYQWLTHWE